MQVAPDLKVCPFCGSKRLVFIGYAIHCGDCSAVGPFAVTEDRARELWNERSTRISVEESVHMDTKAETPIEE